MRGFLNFIREQGVIGLAVGFILGSSVSKVVSSIVNDLINPTLGILFRATGDLKTLGFEIAGTKIMWGNFLSNVLDFIIIAFVVYFIVRGLGFDKLDKKKDA